MEHYSVLLNEAIENLNIKEDGIYVDATLGLGGHSSKILEKLTTGHLYAFDEDKMAIDYADKRLAKINSNYTIIKSNFVNLKAKLEELGVTAIDGIVFDLGVSSPQIDTASRGFSFSKDGLLDMRMDTDSPLTAEQVVNEYKKEELTNIFFNYGEEKQSRLIANKIVAKRPIKTTLELVKVILEAVGANYFYKNHPERKIFQAIRIEVNKELSVLKDVLPDVTDILKPQGRMVIITFHSLEDRIVKKYMKEESEVSDLVKGLPEIPAAYQPKLKLITKKPILPSSEELEANSRSKSAKLRVAEKI
mgnify:FL=1